jgi:hypothetical protein
MLSTTRRRLDCANRVEDHHRRDFCDEQSALEEVEELALRVIAELRSEENDGFWTTLVSRALGRWT